MFASVISWYLQCVVAPSAVVSYENYAVGAEVKTDMGSAVKSVTDYNFAMQFKKDNTNVAVVTYVTIICGIIVLID